MSHCWRQQGRKGTSKANKWRKCSPRGELREWIRIKWKILNMGPKQWAAGVTKSDMTVDMLFGRDEGPSGGGLGDPDTMGLQALRFAKEIPNQGVISMYAE